MNLFAFRIVCPYCGNKHRSNKEGICPHCNKKIWNPDKYGSFIPGMPEDYENSGYCLGTCGISFE